MTLVDTSGKETHAVSGSVEGRIYVWDAVRGDRLHCFSSLKQRLRGVFGRMGGDIRRWTSNRESRRLGLNHIDGSEG